MLLTACFLLLLSLPPAVAADWWDDFSNNFASDLAPLLSLFGEQVTKQFLSESIYFVDYIIFAMAPMGILTAVVSVIRICGSPSLRAFVGRAQEGKGIAEAELCSSTSRDVCELYNNAGIARVFGRPKILEIIFDPENADFQKEAGIYTLRNYLKTEDSVWVKQSGVFSRSTVDVESKAPKESAYADRDVDLFAPNLCLNVGIKRQPTPVSWIVAGVGFFMQSGVMVFAGIVTYYLKWEKEDKPPNSYSCPMTFAGTFLLGIGTFYCAFLIGESTEEQIFMKRDSPSPRSRKSPLMIWVQPGGQVLGDQNFDPFCYSDDRKPLEQYLTSWKKSSVESPFRVWTAIGVTMLGFVLQFTGLRGIHSAVSLAQTAVVLAMSMVRSLLRTQRLKVEDNKLAGFPDLVIGYELDWLALHIGEADLQQHLSVPPHNVRSYYASPRDWPCMWLERLSLRPRDPPLSRDHRETQYFWNFHGISTMKSYKRSELPSITQDFNLAAKIFAYRARLGNLTMSQSKKSRNPTSAADFHIEMVDVRQDAQRLAVAITSALNVLLFSDRSRNQCLRWGLECSISSSQGGNRVTSPKSYTVYLNFSRDAEHQWKLDNNMELESLLGLWVWSLMSDPAVKRKDELSSLIRSRALEIPVRRIVSTAKEIGDLRPRLAEYLPRKAFNFKEHTFDFGAMQPKPGSLWQEFDSKYQPFRGQLKGDLIQPRVVRFFGWTTHDSSNLQNSSGDSGTFKMFSTHTSGTLVSSCAHEVFASLLASVFDIERRSDNDLLLGSHESTEGTPADLVVRAFADSQLGSMEEAWLCVLQQVVSSIYKPRSGRWQE